MLKVGLIGIGFMGRVHLDTYIRLEEEGFPLKLTALCDIDEKKFQGEFVDGNLDAGKQRYDFTKYKCYYDINEMLTKEEFDFIDICLPTYLHAGVSIRALNKGINVLCEKPMALNSEDCKKMIEAAERNKKKLMIGQCLRFWPAYEVLKEYVEKNKLGEALGGYFYRGGSTPIWSYKNWFLNEQKSGGCILDQHIHDVDMINWLFGKPEMVSTLAANVIPESGYDIVSTNYIYEDNKVINAQDDWTLNGEYGFQMAFRVNFENGNIVFEEGTLKINPNNQKGFIPELSSNTGHYNEIKYFAEAVINDEPIQRANPESTMETIIIAEAEVLSASKRGERVMVR